MEEHNLAGLEIKDVILGGQDGLVNVLGIILGVATATSDVRLVLIAGLVAAFAESISMLAVAYTSSKAYHDFYQSELEREKREIEEVPDTERKEIRDIYYKKGFRGGLLNSIVKKITSNKKLWIDIMMKEELNLMPPSSTALRSAVIVGAAALIGSLVPLVPFLFFNIQQAVIWSFIISIAVLFAGGFAKAKMTIGKPIRSGIEMAAVGMAAALAGYLIGFAVGVYI